MTAAVDDLQFLHPIKVGDLIILKSRVTCTFNTSLEVQVDVYSEETLTGRRLLTSRAFLTFAGDFTDGDRVHGAAAAGGDDDERRTCEEAHARRAERLSEELRAAIPRATADSASRSD